VCTKGSGNCSSSCLCNTGYTWDGTNCVESCTTGTTRSCGDCGKQTCNAGGMWAPCAGTPRPDTSGNIYCANNCGVQRRTAVCNKAAATWSVSTSECTPARSFEWESGGGSQGVGAWYDPNELASNSGYGPPVQITFEDRGKPCTFEQCRDKACGYIFREQRNPYMVLNGCYDCFAVGW
jgi:hypothetical protein